VFGLQKKARNERLYIRKLKSFSFEDLYSHINKPIFQHRLVVLKIAYQVSKTLDVVNFFNFLSCTFGKENLLRNLRNIWEVLVVIN